MISRFELTSGIIYSRRPNRNYASLFHNLSHLDRETLEWPAHLAGLSLMAGATFSSWLLHRLHVQWPTPGRMARSVAGGFVMASGSILIPGGHDLLLMWSIPGLAIDAMLAYLVMLAMIALLTGYPLLRAGSAKDPK